MCGFMYMVVYVMISSNDYVTFAQMVWTCDESRGNIDECNVSAKVPSGVKRSRGRPLYTLVKLTLEWRCFSYDSCTGSIA